MVYIHPPKLTWIPKMAIFEAGDTFSKAHHFGALHPLVFNGLPGLPGRPWLLGA